MPNLDSHRENTAPIFGIALLFYYFFVVLFVAHLPYGSGDEWPPFSNLLLNRFAVGAGEGNFSKRMSAEWMFVRVLNYPAVILKKPGFLRNSNFSAKLFQLPFGLAPMSLKWTEKTLLFAVHFSVVGSIGIWVFRRKLNVKMRKRLMKSGPFVIGFLSMFGILVFRRQVFVDDYGIPIIMGIYGYCVGLHFLSKEFQFLEGLILSLSQFAVIFGFILWAPWAYGLPGGRVETRVWFNSWLNPDWQSLSLNSTNAINN